MDRLLLLPDGDIDHIRTALLISIKWTKRYYDEATSTDNSEQAHAVYWWARELGHYGRIALALGAEP